MRNLYLTKKVLVFLLLLGSLQALAQTTQVTGHVAAGDDGTGLPGVSILEKGTTNGTVTDASGNYSISVSTTGTLVFSFVGYTAQEVEVGGRSTLNITLQTDVTALGEVVVVGYGQQEKKDVTGSLTNITSKDFNKAILTNPQDMIVGRVAGVAVTPGSGAPGSGAQIRIRGGSSLNASNDPLIVIDGFPVDNKEVPGASNPLAALNPNDIESFTVLKDASATAIYGSRASNGVIIITTKKGAAGKPTIQYNGTVSISTLAKKVEVMTGDEYRAYIDEKVEEGSVSGLSAASLNRLGTADTDWQDEIYENAVSHDHNVSVSGTWNVLPYRISYGYTDQNGILKNTGFTRNSLNVSLTPSLLDDNLKITASLKSSFSEFNYGSDGAVGAAVTFDPTQVVRNNNTKYGGYYTWTQLSSDINGVMDPEGAWNNIGPSNPVALIEQTNNRADVDRHIGNLQLDYRFPFLPELKLNVNGGFDITKSDGKNIQQNNAAFTLRNGPGGFWNLYTADNSSKAFDTYLNYVKNLGKSRIDLTAGYSYQTFSRDATDFSGDGTGKVINGADTDDDNVPDSPLSRIKDPLDLVSLFARVNYTLADKYLLTATVRNDNSSRFHEDYRSGIFPAVSVGWRISDESFMLDIEQVSDLKLRAGYGITGQQDIIGRDLINPYPYLPRYESSTNTANYQFGNQFYPTLRPQPYDAAIKWEETSTLNIALDFGLFDNKVSGSFDVFRRQTNDLIGFIPIAPGSNFSNYLLTNVGDMDINGYEITLNFNPIRKEDFNWNFGVNFTAVESEITNLTKTDDPNFSIPTGGIAGGVGNNIQLHAVGSAPSSFYAFQQVYAADGMPIQGLYVDRTGEGGSVTSNERNKHLNKDPMADFLVGFNSSLVYKGFDFSFSSRLSVGNYVYNNVMSSNAINSQLFNQSGFFSNVPVAIRETDFNSQELFSSHYLENASFFKLDNISAGYTLNELVNSKLKARFSFTVQNALVVTDYSGIDPEHSNGIDNNLYPRPRTFLFGVNLTY